MPEEKLYKCSLCNKIHTESDLEKNAAGELLCWVCFDNMRSFMQPLNEPKITTTVNSRQQPYRSAEVELGREKDTRTPVFLPEKERTYHTVIIGQTQYGKTSVLEHLVLEDLKNDRNAVLFDPHGDLTEDLLLQASSAHKADKVFLYEITPESSYIFNPVEVKNPNDPMEVSRTVDSLMQVFRKHWTNYAWGPRVEWVLSNCLRALVSNPGHTLDEVPLLLRDDAFRSRFLPQITNPQVQEFWRWYRTLESTRRPQDEWQLIESTLTRLSQFLANEWLVRILYQPKSTVDFGEIINNTAGQLTIFSLPIGRLGEEPAALLGSLLLGRLATTIFGRIDYGAQLPRLHIYIDELSRFSLPITARLWTEGGKYNIGLTATLQTLSQLQDDENKAAVLQAGNHVCFQCIGADAQVFSQQMPLPDPSSLMKPEPMLLYSQTAIEDIWQKGHPNPAVMAIRDAYFWIVDILKRNPHQEYFEYDPAPLFREHPSWKNARIIWYMYRASADMLKEGIRLLDQYYYNWMDHQYGYGQRANPKDIQLVRKIMECLAGYFGWQGCMQPYMTEEKQDYFYHRLREYIDQIGEKYYKQLPPQHYVPTRNEQKETDWRFKRLQAEHQQLLLDLHTHSLVNGLDDLEKIKQLAIEIGIPSYEIEKLIAWKVLPNIEYVEEGRIKEVEELLKDVQKTVLTQMPEKARTALAAIPTAQQDFELAAWQLTQRITFIKYGLRGCGAILEKEPLHVPSTSYRDVEYSRRTYADVRDELAQRLVSLPRYEAIAALVSEGKTVHIKTIPLPALSPAAKTGAEFIRNRSRQQVNKPMQEIMETLKKRNRPSDPGSLPPSKPHI